MNNVENQISRMKAMMTFGLQTENKNNYSSVEYHREGADGKVYGIVREGTKYYVKVANKNSKLLKEDFDYIGGFRNRKNNEYTSYANALKNFDMKMLSLKESHENKNVIIESWNPDKKEELMVESTERMRKEIARQRQIMNNAVMISEGKACECGTCNPKEVAYAEVSPKCKNGNPFCEDPKTPEGTPNQDNEKNNIGKANAPVKGKAVKESAEPLAWHKEGGDASQNIADTYIDTSKGTEIGDGAPFEKLEGSTDEAKNGVVEEGTSMAMDCGDNQNSPKPGVGEIGDDAPFDEKAKNELQEAEEGEEILDDDDTDDEFVDDDFEDDSEGDEFVDDDTEDNTEGDEEASDFDSDLEDETDDEDGMESRLSTIEDLLSKIVEKLGIDQFEDEPLYDDDTEDDIEIELGDDADFDTEDDFGGEEDFEDDFDEVIESRSYRKQKAMNEDKLDYFGKHPAYQKEPMELPQTGEDSNEHASDWNHESVYSEQPFGEKIGSSAPFEIDPETIENAIAESIKRYFKKNI